MTERLDVLDNPRSTRVGNVAGLSRRSARQRHRQFLVEGPQAVRELVSHAPGLVRDVYVTDAVAARERATVSRARAAGLYLHRVTAEVAAAMSPDAQGILAVATMPPPPGLEVLEGARLAVLLPRVSDPGNAGTLIRIADAAGAAAVVACHGSVEVTSPKVVRATAGSLFHLPVVTGVSFADAVGAARAAGLQVIGADAASPHSVFGLRDRLGAPTAWVFGHEAHGLSAPERELCDLLAAIPIHGRAESLNVAAAAAVCLYASAESLD